MPALLVQMRPCGAWRNGPATGERERVDPVLHSDTLHAALCHAMAALGWIDEWLGATQAAGVRLTSLFPWQGEDFYVPPPKHIWPPVVTNLRAAGASFVPVKLVASLLEGQVLREDLWRVDGLSRCLHSRHYRTGPFRIALRSRAGVDRATQAAVEVHRTACLEFADEAGLWCAAEFDDAVWEHRLKRAFAWLADSGLGGERSSGWGHFTQPRFRTGELPALLGLPEADAEAPTWWLLSVLAPADADAIDWTRGNYETTSRGRLDTTPSTLVLEGSVIASATRPTGKAWEPSPGICRSGLALALAVTGKGVA